MSVLKRGTGRITVVLVKPKAQSIAVALPPERRRENLCIEQDQDVLKPLSSALHLIRGSERWSELFRGPLAYWHQFRNIRCVLASWAHRCSNHLRKIRKYEQWQDRAERPGRSAQGVQAIQSSTDDSGR